MKSSCLREQEKLRQTNTQTHKVNTNVISENTDQKGPIQYQINEISNCQGRSHNKKETIGN